MQEPSYDSQGLATGRDRGGSHLAYIGKEPEASERQLDQGRQNCMMRRTRQGRYALARPRDRKQASGTRRWFGAVRAMVCWAWLLPGARQPQWPATAVSIRLMAMSISMSTSGSHRRHSRSPT